MPAAPAPPVRAAIQPAVLRGAPSLFGSVALAVAHTTEDGQWRRIADSRLPADGGPWSGVLRRARGLPELEQMRLVNAWVNSEVAFTPDSRLYGASDYWATAAETLSRGQGDCEDFAIAKLQMLQALGVPTDDLYLVIARDLVRRADHAVLAVRAEGRWWVLDSGADIIAAEDVQDYRPIMTFSGSREWIHGYRRQLPPVIMASAETSELAAVEARQGGR